MANKFNFLVAVEMVGVITGIIALITSIMVLMNWGNLDISTRDFFRGGHPGAQIIAVAAITGFFSSILFIVNVTSGRKQFSGLRLICIVVFFGSIVCLGTMA